MAKYIQVFFRNPIKEVYGFDKQNSQCADGKQQYAYLDQCGEHGYSSCASYKRKCGHQIRTA